MDADHQSIISLLGHHLLLLNGTYAVLGVKHNNPRPLHPGEACQCCLPGITGSRRQNHDLILHLILLRSSDHQMRQYRQRHILKSDRRTMKQLHIICTFRLHDRRNHFRVKLRIIRLCDTASQFCFRKIRQK